MGSTTTIITGTTAGWGGFWGFGFYAPYYWGASSWGLGWCSRPWGYGYGVGYGYGEYARTRTV